MSLIVGCCSTAFEAGAAFEFPSKFTPEKDSSKKGRGYLSCPSVRSYFENIFQVKSPFSLQLRLTKSSEGYSFQPVYPFTTLSESKFLEFLIIEPVDSWRNSYIPAIQFPSPYVFFTDVPATIEQFTPTLANSSSMNWRVIPGKFNIYDWQRPLNWAIEWDTRQGDLIIRTGEPLYFVKFTELSSNSNEVELVNEPLTEIIQERLRLSRGITGIRKSTLPLMKKTGETRAGKKLISKDENQ
jgi:hypothetical protein